MSWLAYSFFGGTALFFIVGLFIYRMYRKSYKYVAWIIAQVGDTHVLIQDKFQVYKTNKNSYALKFYHQKDLERSSPPYSMWSLFGVGKKTNDLLKDSDPDKKTNEYSKAELDKILARGAIFKKTSEGDIHPAVITEEADIKVLSQDDRTFSALAAEETERLTGSAWDKYGRYVLTGLTIMVCAGIFIFTFVYLNQTLSQGIADVCSGASSVARAQINASTFMNSGVIPLG